MRIPYLGLLALGGRAEENRILEIEKSVLEQLEQGTFVNFFIKF
jgi:hypothetical protein